MDGETIRKVAEAQSRIQRGEASLRQIRTRMQDLTSAKNAYESEIAFLEQQVQFYLRKLREHKVSNIQNKETGG